MPELRYIPPEDALEIMLGHDTVTEPARLLEHIRLFGYVVFTMSLELPPEVREWLTRRYWWEVLRHE